MSHPIVFCVILAFLSAVASIPTVRNEFEPDDNIEYNPEDFELPWQNMFREQSELGVKIIPGVQNLFLTSQLTAVPSAQLDDPIKYTIGKRVPNDRIVSHGIDGGKWSSPVNVTLTLKYPSSGQGAKVTYAEFYVKQSSKIGQVKVKDGGIGQRSIAILLEASNTLYFGYRGAIYGI